MPGLPCHSYQPSAGTMHLRLTRADLKDGFSAAVSLRALIIREPIVGSFAQLGTKPQVNAARSLSSVCETIAGIWWVGATLKFGENGSDSI